MDDGSIFLEPSRERIGKLRELILEKMRPLLAGRQVLYLDLPIHLNIGDLLIEHGTYRLFDELGVGMHGRGSLLDEDRILGLSVPRDVLIVLHGGGNFGDIYPYHQRFRLAVVQAFPNNPIIMLPQSIHYDDETTFNLHAEVLNQHSNLKLYVRDQNSYDFLARRIPTAKLGLLPDMATMLLGHWEWPEKKAPKTLVFRRRDCESKMEKDLAAMDWKDLISRSDRHLCHLIKRILKVQNRLKLDLGGYHLWSYFSRRMVRKAVACFNGYGCIDTDRLHGFILAHLMGIPVVCRDNSYGKLKRYISAWLHC